MGGTVTKALEADVREEADPEGTLVVGATGPAWDELLATYLGRRP